MIFNFEKETTISETSFTVWVTASTPELMRQPSDHNQPATWLGVGRKEKERDDAGENFNRENSFKIFFSLTLKAGKHEKHNASSIYFSFLINKN